MKKDSFLKNEKLSIEELQVLYAVAKIAATNRSSVIKTILTILEKLDNDTPFHNGVVKIFNSNNLPIQPISNLPEKDIDNYYNLLSKVKDSKRPFFQAGFSKEKLVKLRPGETVYGIPVLHDNIVIGVISFIKRDVANRETVETDVHFLQQFALFLAETVIEKAEQKISLSALSKENLELKNRLISLEKKGHTPHIIGNSEPVKKLFREIAQVAETDTIILINGETGTGKELVAKTLFDKSLRNNNPFIVINCAALPDTLLEGELFGYERGAFTGALKKRVGSFQRAHGGTIFLDEIGEMSLDAQSRLLRVIQEREVQPIGSDELFNIDVRIICATNRDLEKAVKEGRFREDLYYRINVFTIELPPLRERKSDIELLANFFIKNHCKRLNRPSTELHESTLNYLNRYNWPGNIRELQNSMERAILLSISDVILPENLPIKITSNESTSNLGLSLEEQIAMIEKKIIKEALHLCKGNQRKTAEFLKTTKRVIQYKIEKLEIPYRNFKNTT